MAFVANELQRKFVIGLVSEPRFAESLGATEFNRRAHTFLLGLKSELTPIATLARDCLEMHSQGRKTVIAAFLQGLTALHNDALACLKTTPCLTELAEPKALFSDSWLENLKKLATLDEGL